MEAFQLLSRGGVRFNKERFKSDVQLFSVCFVRCCPPDCHSMVVSSPQVQRSPYGSAGESNDSATELPSELDFFKYNQGGAQKRKLPQPAMRNPVSSEESQKETDSKRARTELGEKGEGPSQPRQRVTAKGVNIPEPLESIDDLQSKCGVPSRITQKLREYGYTSLTPIQSHAVPILLQVCYHRAWLVIRFSS